MYPNLSGFFVIISQMELKRINFLNFDTLKKALADKEASLVKGTATKKQGK